MNTHKPRLLTFLSTVSLSHRNPTFWKYLMSLHVIYVLPPPPPPNKNRGSAYGLCTYAEWIFMVNHCDSASNMGWDALYHTAYLRERLLAEIRLTLRKCNTNNAWSKLTLVWNGIWKKNLEWNERKLPVWNMEKLSSTPYHALIVLPTTRHRCDIFSKGAVLLGRSDVKMCPRQFVTRFGVLQLV